MLMLNEAKKNLFFFVLMTLVLILLMSAGVSLFNFSFEINRVVTEMLEEDFEFGYEVYARSFIDPETQRLNGVDYYGYGTNVRFFDENEDLALFSQTYFLEDYLPKNFAVANNDVDNFLVDGRFWNSLDNAKIDGKHSIFLSDELVEEGRQLGFFIAVGSEFCLKEIVYYDYDEQTDEYTPIFSTPVQFVVRGIYKGSAANSQLFLPEAVISLAAEKDILPSTEYIIDETYLNFNTLDNFKKFTADAKRNNIEYNSYIEEDLGLVGLFSGIFGFCGIVILSLCGLTAYIYCGMYVSRRINFFGLIMALGYTAKQIAKQLFVLLLIILMFAFVVGNVFSTLITSHFSKLAFELFEYKLDTGFNALSQVVFAVFTVFTAVLTAVFLGRKISKLSVTKILMQRE